MTTTVSGTATTHELLGDDAEPLLTYAARGFDKKQLHLPGPDFVDRVLAISDRPPGVLRSFQQILDTGRLAPNFPKAPDRLVKAIRGDNSRVRLRITLAPGIAGRAPSARLGQGINEPRVLSPEHIASLKRLPGRSRRLDCPEWAADFCGQVNIIPP